jgi:hypothetical protein
MERMEMERRWKGRERMMGVWKSRDEIEGGPNLPFS